MKKRIIALILCLVLSASALVGCAGSIDADSEYKGEQITMYLTDNIYDLDPANAYTNEVSRSIVSLLFDTLFTVDENGKVTESLAKSYKTETTKDGEILMYIEIKEDARWSDNQPVTADDVVFAWKRVLNPNNSYSCASLLFDIKNARAYNAADVSKDDVGLSADGKLLTIQFEKEIDYDQFILNLTSLALAPLREDIASKNADWAKKPGIMTASGPFKLSKIGFYTDGEVEYRDINYSVKQVDDKNKVVLDKNGNPVFIAADKYDDFAQQKVHSYMLERNLYYYRNAEDAEKLDVSVTPYRIIVDCSMSDAEILQAYNDGIIAYVGDIPMSIRQNVKESATVYSSLSTNTCYLNQNADIVNKGEIVGYEDEAKTVPVYGTVKLFADKSVRQALSLALDREAIANAVVFAKAATGIVPNGVYDSNSSKTLFRDACTTSYKFLSKNVAEAQKLLAAANITPANYSFTITVAEYDEVHMQIANAAVAAWGKDGLGFDVTVNVRGTIANNDYHKDVSSVPGDLCDDLWAEDLRAGEFEAIILDLVAPSTDPFSVLAPFAKQFSGQKMDMSDSENYQLSAHITGYDSTKYNDLMEKIYNNKTTSSRAADLHAAEAILMEDMPVIPIIFNESAYLLNEDVLDLNNKILFWDKASEYYYPVLFDKMSIKNYEDYEIKCAKYIYENFDAWKEIKGSYFNVTFSDLTKEEFVYTNSNYFYLFKDKCTYDEKTQEWTFAEGYEWMPKNPKIVNAESETESASETEAESAS